MEMVKMVSSGEMSQPVELVYLGKMIIEGKMI